MLGIPERGLVLLEVLESLPPDGLLARSGSHR